MPGVRDTPEGELRRLRERERKTVAHIYIHIERYAVRIRIARRSHQAREYASDAAHVAGTPSPHHLSTTAPRRQDRE